jgi:hypothetical protein
VLCGWVWGCGGLGAGLGGGSLNFCINPGPTEVNPCTTNDNNKPLSVDRYGPNQPHHQQHTHTHADTSSNTCTITYPIDRTTHTHTYTHIHTHTHTHTHQFPNTQHSKNARFLRTEEPPEGSPPEVITDMSQIHSVGTLAQVFF